MLTAYPIARDAHGALDLLKQGGDTARAAREKEAEARAGRRVAFVTQSLGPVYDSETDALKAYKGVLDNGVCKLACRIKDAPRARARSSQPVFAEGERWPKATVPRDSVWQLTISYWKIMDGPAAHRPAPAGDPRTLRKRARKGDLTPEEMLALMDSPLIAPRPQKALDFGLFDFIPPDNPGIVIADE